MNKFAISSGGIGEALQRSAASLSAANNTIDESIALIVAANNVIQDPATVGTMWKTVSMRIRGAKTELEDAGLEIDGMATSTAKLREQVSALTNVDGMGGFDIMKDENTFKSTYDIILGIGKVWQDISDIDQAALLELLAGKRQGNALAAALTNLKDLQGTLKVSEESAGSAAREHEIWLDSIDARVNQFKASFEALSSTILNSELAKNIIDTGTDLLQTITAIVDGLGGIKNTLILLIAIKTLSVIKGDLFALKKAWDISGLAMDTFGKRISLVQKLLSGTNITMTVLAGTAATLLMAIGAVTFVFNTIQKVNEEARQAAEDSAVAYKDTAESMDEYKSKAIELRKEIDSGNLSETEAYEKRKELLKIQESLIDKFGEEAKGINLVTGSINDQIDALDELSGKEWERFKQSNIGAIQDSVKLFTDYNEDVKIKNLDSADLWRAYLQSGKTNDKTKLEEFVQSTQDDFSKRLQKELPNLRVGIGEESFKLKTSSIKEAREYYQTALKIAEELGREKFGDNYLTYMGGTLEYYSNKIAEFDEEIANHEKIFNTYVEGLLAYDKEYSQAWGNILAARKKYNDAVLANDKNGALAAVEEMNKAKDAFLNAGIDNEAIKAYVNDYFDAFEEETSNEQFELKIVPRFEKDKKFKDDLKKAAKEFSTDGEIDIVAVSNAGIDYEANRKENKALTDKEKSYELLLDTAKEYGVTVEDLITLMGEQNIVNVKGIDLLEKTSKGYGILTAQMKHTTEAYTAWQNVQNQADPGDMYDETTKAFKALQEGIKTLKTGTSEYEAAENLLIPDNIKEKGIEAVKDYTNTFLKPLFAEVKEGETGITRFNNFMQKSVNEGLATWQDGNWVINPDVNLEDFIEKLGITKDLALAIFGELEEYEGVHFDFLDRDYEKEALNLIDQLTKKKKELNDITDTNSQEYKTKKAEIDEINTSLANLPEEVKTELSIVFNENGEVDIAKTKAASAMDKINKAFEAAKQAITNDEDQTKVKVLVNVDDKKVDDLNEKINKIDGKKVKIETIVENSSSKPSLFSNLKLGIGNNYITGQAHARGTFGAEKTTTALVGELGQELYVNPKSGTWRTIGDNGAEFFQVNKGDIIFNAQQTRELLRTGKTRSRGKSYLNGTVYESGTWNNFKNNVVNMSGLIPKTSLSKRGSTSSSKKNSDDTLKEIQDAFDKSLKNMEHRIFLMEKGNFNPKEIISLYQKMQDDVQAQAQKYRKMGLSEDSEYIQNLQKQWWDYYDTINELSAGSYDDRIKNSENAISLIQNQLNQAIKNSNYKSVQKHTDDIVSHYRSMQETIHEQAEYYRSLGYAETSDEISELSTLWWDYEKEIEEATETAFQALVQNANDALDEIQNVYSTLKNAAKEFSQDGFISVDTFQDILSLGTNYLAMLSDENGKLVINEENIKRVIKAKTQQVAVETALNYIASLRNAQQNKDTAALENLLFATNKTTGSTWELVYAQLALLNLSDKQYNAAVQQINTIRSLADTASLSIGQVSGQITEELEKTSQSLDDILKYTIEMIKQETNNQITALKDQVKSYRNIVDLQKKSLELTKEQDDYDDEVSKKVKSISKLESQIQLLSLDDSREAKAQRAKLEEELAEKQKELADYQSDYAHKAILSSLDAQADAYEQEKEKEIAILENNINSYEKVYQLAIKRIDTDWNKLYTDLISWNTQYGSDTNEQITTAWKNASASVKEYHGWLETVEETQKRMNTALGNSDSENIIGNANRYSTDEKAGKQISNLINQMKMNSSEWHSPSADKKGLENENLRISRQIESLIGERLVLGDDGNWYVGSVGKQNLLYKKYHSGGIIGDTPTIRDNESLNILEKGELVLNQGKKENFYRLIDMGKEYGSLVKNFMTTLFNGSLPNTMTRNYQEMINGKQQVMSQTSVSNNSSPTIKVSAPIQIYGDVDKDTWTKIYPALKSHQQQVAEIVHKETLSVYSKRGIKK